MDSIPGKIMNIIVCKIQIHVDISNANSNNQVTCVTLINITEENDIFVCIV